MNDHMVFPEVYKCLACTKILLSQAAVQVSIYTAQLIKKFTVSVEMDQGSVICSQKVQMSGIEMPFLTHHW